MIQYLPVKIQIPKKFLLDGLLLKQNSSDTFYIFIHGLGGNLFSQIELAQKLSGPKNNILVFNNRGNGIISKIKQIDTKNAHGYKSHSIGMAHEIFTDCLDDIEGAINYVSKLGAKKIFLIGHSTGCQKSIYYLSKKANPLVKGVVLLAPMSDFADTFAFTEKKVYQKAVAYSKKKISNGCPHDLLPPNIWKYTIDAQRFLSLYTADSKEEIFSYASGKKPITLKKVKEPILVMLAGNDEYRDRPVSEIATWFERVLSGYNIKIETIDNAPHSFKEYTDDVVKEVKNWSKKHLV